MNKKEIARAAWNAALVLCLHENDDDLDRNGAFESWWRKVEDGGALCDHVPVERLSATVCEKCNVVLESRSRAVVSVRVKK